MTVGRAAALLAAALLACGATDAAAAGRPHVRRTVYVNCATHHPGRGTEARPLGSLTAANAVTLRPGSRLKLRRGTSCAGTLAPRGSGSAGRPAVIGAYGRGARPRIDATGTDALVLEDTDHVIAQDLELTDKGPAGIRRGVHIVAATHTLTGVTVRRLWVHDVTGDLTKGRGGTGGVQVDATGPPPIRFSGLTIEDNRIERVSRTGISMVGTLDPGRPDAGQPWPNASTGVLIARNRIDDVAGDGIVPRGTVGAVVEDNVVSRGNRSGVPLLSPAGAVCDAGIWTFHADGTVIQRNEVFGMEAHDCDGTGFDVDYDQDGTVVQHNYSHDNQGGFVLLCSDDVAHHRADVRYNLSVDDASTLNTVPCRATEGVIGDLSGLRFYNNTVVAAHPRVVAEQFELPQLVGGGTFAFANNLLVATTPQSQAFPCGAHCTHTLSVNMPPAGEDPVSGTPAFADATRRGAGRLAVGGGFRLRAGSPGAAAGTPLRYAGSSDYFGTPIPATPSVGFAEPGP